jgi:hypothetical protein
MIQYYACTITHFAVVEVCELDHKPLKLIRLAIRGKLLGWFFLLIHCRNQACLGKFLDDISRLPRSDLVSKAAELIR